MIAQAALALICLCLAAYILWQTRSSTSERASLLTSFAAEREVWARERRDLNNRIQIPQAAPFMEVEEGPTDNDLPLPPDFAIDEDEFQKAVEHLESVGYENGPAT